jgi:hypothetical protein
MPICQKDNVPHSRNQSHVLSGYNIYDAHVYNKQVSNVHIQIFKGIFTNLGREFYKDQKTTISSLSNGGNISNKH